MADQTVSEATLRALAAPERNRYFYGKLLDDRHLTLEQCYSLKKRWMLNRLTLGAGVLCGLRVIAGADGTVAVTAGVAIDGVGREIVVPANVVIDPAQPTDACGLPVGATLTTGQTTISLCYTECGAEPVRALIGGCDTTAAMVDSTVVERFRLTVSSGLPVPVPDLTAEQLAAIYPTDPPDGFSRRIATEQTLAGAPTADPPCPAPEATCVVLATVTLADGETPMSIDEFTYRSEVFSNTVLFELIAGLAARVDACCKAHEPPTYTAAKLDGDAQIGAGAAVLPAPLRVLVADGSGTGAAGQVVTFAVGTGDPSAGTVSADQASWGTTVAVTTGPDGIASCSWTLGTPADAAGFTQTVTAQLGTDAPLTFTASVEQAQPPDPPPPVVKELDPANGTTVPGSWQDGKALRLAFDQPMLDADLADPDAWLRAWGIPPAAQDQARIVRLKVFRTDQGDGTGAAYGLDGDVPFPGATVVVVMRSSGAEISSTTTPSAELDADFAGTKLDPDQLARLWDTDVDTVDATFLDALVATDKTPPSGDGTAGGTWHSIFGISSEDH